MENPVKTVRKEEIDILKGIGIIAVFIGHMGSPYGGQTIVAYAYSFHMPLFFLATGFLAFDSNGIDFKNYVKRKINSLIIPYVFLFFFSFLWTNTIYAKSHGNAFFIFPFKWVDFLKAFFLSGGYMEKIPINNFPLWFLPLLFLACVLFYPITKIKDKKIVLTLAILVSILTIPYQLIVTGRPAWHINVLPVAIFYMIIGYLFYIYSERDIIKKFYRTLMAMMLLVSGFIVFSLVGSDGGVAHITSYWYYIGSLLTVMGFYIFSRSSKNRFLRYLGRNSLYFFSLQALILLQLPNLGIDQYFINNHFDGIVLYGIQLLSGILLTSILVFAFKKLASLISNIYLRKVATDKLNGETEI